MSETILVTGATGTVGSRVTRQLLKRVEQQGDKQRVVAAVRSADKARALAEAGAHIVEMSFDRPGALEQAMAHVDKLFLLTPPDLSTIQASQTAIAAAAAAGVKYVVKLSAFGAEMEPPIALARLHRSAEMLIMGTEMDWTFLRPNGFMQNMEQFAGNIKEGHSFSLPLGGAAVSFVDADDIAAVAVEMLLGKEGENSGKAYDLTGPAAITGAEMAETFTKILGWPVSYRRAHDSETRDLMVAHGTSAPLADALVELYQSYQRGEAAAVSNAVSSITGRSARSFEQYLFDNRAAYSD